MKTPDLKTKRNRRCRVRRFTDKQAELAAKISNDIAEDIDCGESRETLRMAVSYFADVACVESQRRAAAESTVAIFKSAKALMDVVLLPPSVRSTALVRPSRDPQTLHGDAWYYEYPSRIEVVIWTKAWDGTRTVASVNVPWKKLEASHARCRPNAPAH